MSIENNVWVLKYAPKSLDDLILSEENREKFSAMTNIPNNLLFIGKPGCGKTTLAKLLAKKFSPNSYIYINASDENGIDTVRNKISSFISTVSFDGNQKVVILDEASGLSFSAQQALNAMMEEYLEDVKFILTGNYKHKIISSVISRCQSYDFNIDLKMVTRRIIEIAKKEGIKIISEPQKQSFLKLIKNNFPDIRKTINDLQRCFVNGIFSYIENNDGETAEKIYEMLKNKTDAFKIREYVISKEAEFNNDYQFLMRNLFDCFIKDCKIEASLLTADYMYKDALVVDKEVNFSALIFNLSKLS